MIRYLKATLKLFVPAILIAFVFIGCGKNNNVTPVKKPDTPLTDDQLHNVAFGVPVQTVKTSVTGTKLTMVFTENVNLYINADGYTNTSAVHLLGDFNHSLLNGFEFTTVNESGDTTLNFVDDNLNNVKLKTITDTVINSINVVKINVNRPITYFMVYDSNQTAVNEQNLLLADVSDIVTYSSYCYYNLKVYPTSMLTAHITYTK
jgi:hypothetical protein